MGVKIKRAYDPPGSRDGYRVLVDGVWPRGMSKDELHLDAWYRDLAPTATLRKWFGHDPEKWSGFRTRYRRELRTAKRAALLEELAAIARERTVTLVYGARDAEHNQAVVLLECLGGKST